MRDSFCAIVLIMYPVGQRFFCIIFVGADIMMMRRPEARAGPRATLLSIDGRGDSTHVFIKPGQGVPRRLGPISMKYLVVALFGAIVGTSALAQVVPMAAAPTAMPVTVMLPADTVIQVTPVQEISSINMKVGDVHMLQVATDVAQNGTVVIPRGAPVKSTVSYRTGKGIGGKSAKFELTFDSVTVN